MASGSAHNQGLDPLTIWELAAVNILIVLDHESKLDVKASRENMLALMAALDQGALDAFLEDPDFLSKTEALLLTILRGERITVGDPTTYAARKEIFTAAQVVYNHAVARGTWMLHPEIQKAMQDSA